ncbi:MAG: hypothetical protein ABIF17_02115 [Patescibacteria group bacterium]
MSDKKIRELKKLVDTAEIALQTAREILFDLTGGEDYSGAFVKAKSLKQETEGGSQIIEGVFDGQQMIGSDGKQYSVPVNYASKSKLVEGDILKLTIAQDGSFVFKQIGPIDRIRLKGILIYDNETDGYRVMTEDGKNFKLLTASVTYFKGEPGDEVVILVPKNSEATWSALENVVKKSGQEYPIKLEESEQKEIEVDLKNIDEI